MNGIRDTWAALDWTTQVAVAGALLVAAGLAWVVVAAARRGDVDAELADVDHGARVLDDHAPFTTGTRVSHPVEGLGLVADVPRLPGLVPVRFDHKPDPIRWVRPDLLLVVTAQDEALIARMTDRAAALFRDHHANGGAHTAPSCCSDHEPTVCRLIGRCCDACLTSPPTR